MASVNPIANIVIDLQKNTDRTVYATWSWDKASTTDHYEVRWDYTTGNLATNKKPQWFISTEENVTHTQSIFTPPANALSVRVQVKPVAKAKSESDSAPQWTTNWTKFYTYSFTEHASAITQTIPAMEKSAVGLRKEAGTDRTYWSEWTWSRSHTAGYAVYWEYYTANKEWFIGNSETVTDKFSSYTAPNNALRIKVRIKPIAETYPDSAIDTPYWVCKGYSEAKLLVIEKDTEVSSETVTNLRLDKQNGTDRTVYATWTWNKSYTDHYEAVWQYAVPGNTTWFDGSRSSVTSKISLYDAPQNAKNVRVTIRPVSKIRASNKYFWTAKSLRSKTFNIGEEAPDIQNKIPVKKTCRLVAGTERTLVAQWQWKTGSIPISSFEIEWEYRMGGVTTWTPGSSATVPVTAPNSTYNVPTEAVEVRYHVKGVSSSSSVTFPFSGWVVYSLKVSEPETKKSKAAVSEIRLQVPGERTLYATWDWDYTSTTDHYRTVWQYTTPGSGIWFDGQVNENEKRSYSIYTPPSGATKIRFFVTPIAKKKTVRVKDDTYYWIALQSDPTTFSYTDVTDDPAIAPTPTISIDGLTLTAKVVTYDPSTTVVEFDVIKNNQGRFKIGRSLVTYNEATFTCSVDAGNFYKVRARGMNPLDSTKLNEPSVNLSKLQMNVGTWSEYTDNVDTIPATPVGFTSHQVVTETSVRLTWDKVATADSYDVEYATDLSYFDVSDQTTTKSVDGVGAILITGLDSGNEYFFRVRSVNEVGPSGWCPEIYKIVLGKVPSPPTTWSETTTAVIGESVNLYWVHNSEDSSVQKDAEIELNLNGVISIVEATHLSIDDTASYYTFSPVTVGEHETVDDNGDSILDSEGNTIIGVVYSDYPEGASLRWRVRTKGVVNEFSEWSGYRTVIFYAVPTLELSVSGKNDSKSPAYGLRSYPIFINAIARPTTQTAIGFNVDIIANESYETIDEDGQSRRIRERESVYSRYIPSTQNTLNLELSAGDVNLDKNVSYILMVTAAMDSGLTADATWVFTVAWDDEDLVPDADVTIDADTLCAYIRPYCLVNDVDYIDDVLLSVYRREYDGRLTLIESGLVNDGSVTITDPHPALNYARYRVVAQNQNTGAVGFYDLPGVPVGETGIVIQWDDTWENFNLDQEEAQGNWFANPVWSGSMLKLPYNVGISDDYSPDVAFVSYAGRSHPVSYYGTQLGVSSNWTAEIVRNDIETLYQLRRLAIYTGNAYVREPSGSGYWAQVNVSFNRSYNNMLIPITLNITRVEGGV